MSGPAVTRPKDQTKELDLEAMERELAELSAHIESAKYRLLTLIRLFDEAEGWSRQGFVSCAAFLGYRIGLGKVAAREHVRVAKALPELPQISESMKKGQLSFSKVRAMTRVATPQNESELLSIAKAGTAHHVEKVVRTMRRAAGPADAQEATKQHDERHLQLLWNDDGTLDLRAKLPAELGAIVQKAIERAMEKQEQSDHDKESTHSQRMADGLVTVAESALSSDIEKGVPAERVQVVLHVAKKEGKVSAETLSGEQVGVSAETPNAELEAVLEPGGVGVSAETARRLSCDCSVVHDDGAVSEGRKRRLPHLPLRRALLHRDKGCAFPGCGHERHLHAHHIEHWIDGGETTKENLVMLCSHHHRAVHEGGFDVRCLQNGELAFFDPGGQRMKGAPPLLQSSGGSEALRQLTEEQGQLVDWQTMPLWQGEKMDLSWSWGLVSTPRP